MLMELKKKLGWALLGVGAGGLLLAIVFLATVPAGKGLLLLQMWVWPMGSLGCMVLAGLLLQRFYRQAPFEGTGRWRFTFGGLLAAVWLGGAVLGLYLILCKERLFLAGSAIALCACAGYLAALMVAERRGGTGGWQRLAEAFALFVTACGLLATGGIAFVLLASLLYVPSFSEAYKKIACAGDAEIGHLTFLFYGGPLCLLLGSAMGWVVRMKAQDESEGRPD
jgi:hypothetical protein